MGYWFGEAWGYIVILGAIYGAVVGWGAKRLLHWAEEKNDWFRQESHDDSLQPTIDMLLNLSIFMWYGAVAPWHAFAHNEIIPIYRLIFLGILILLLRRIPFIFAARKALPQIEDKRQALTAGFFGPIGVSAIFYLFTTVDFLNAITVDGVGRPDAERLAEATRIIVWFLCICSIVSPLPPRITCQDTDRKEQIVHGLSVPFGKLGYHLPRTWSGKPIVPESDPEEPEPPHPVRIHNRFIRAVLRLFGKDTEPRREHYRPEDITAPTETFRIGGSVIPSEPTPHQSGVANEPESSAAPSHTHTHTHTADAETSLSNKSDD
ncbi:MAG: hypothetical protein LQ350_007655 [Teloschistes chrysophthalmus]|nr:MAG: hypothetical protein LQ350_007655 [Niorma chrysophthalma]